MQIVESYCCGMSQAGELQESADTGGECGGAHVYLMKNPHEEWAQLRYWAAVGTGVGAARIARMDPVAVLQAGVASP